MSKPLLILVGADKGGVGKTTVSRALDDYLQSRRAVRSVFDSEFPHGDLAQFVPDAQVVDIQRVDDQMRVFDTLRGVTLLDVKAGLFSEVLASFSRVGLLDDVRRGHMNLMLLHVLGPSPSSLREIAHASAVLGAGSHHVLVKNLVNESGFEEWDADPRFASTLAAADVISVPHMPGRASTEVQMRGVSFSEFSENRENSRMLRGYVAAWLLETYAAFDAAGIHNLIEETRS